MVIPTGSLFTFIATFMTCFTHCWTLCLVLCVHLPNTTLTRTYQVDIASSLQLEGAARISQLTERWAGVPVSSNVVIAVGFQWQLASKMNIIRMCHDYSHSAHSCNTCSFTHLFLFICLTDMYWELAMHQEDTKMRKIHRSCPHGVPHLVFYKKLYCIFFLGGCIYVTQICCMLDGFN